MVIEITIDTEYVVWCLRLQDTLKTLFAAENSLRLPDTLNTVNELSEQFYSLRIPDALNTLCGAENRDYQIY